MEKEKERVGMMSEKRLYRCGIRDDLGNSFKEYTVRIEGYNSVEACMEFYRLHQKFPTEVLWLPEEARETDESRAVVLLLEVDRLRQGREGYVTQIKFLEQKMRKVEAKEAEWKTRYRLLRHYLEKILLNTEAVLTKLQEEDPLAVFAGGSDTEKMADADTESRELEGYDGEED